MIYESIIHKKHVKKSPKKVGTQIILVFYWYLSVSLKNPYCLNHYVHFVNIMLYNLIIKTYCN